MSSRLRALLGLGLILAGLFVLAFSQVTRVFNDPSRYEISGSVNDTINDPTFTVLSALLLGPGLAVAVGAISPARGWRRALALAVTGVSLALLVVLHFNLFVNSATVATEDDLRSVFTASYLFHTSPDYSIMAVYLLFLLTVALLGCLVAAVGYLLLAGRFTRGIWDRGTWAKNEANLVTTSLFLVLTLAFFLVYLVRIAVDVDERGPTATGLLADNLVAFYYLQAIALGLLLLTVAARVFLVNWGLQLPLDRATVRDGLRNIGHAERALLGAALLLDLLILANPAAADNSEFSRDPVFYLNSRGLAWFFFLVFVPYLPYAWTQRRLRGLLERGQPFGETPFSQASLRLVLLHLAGLALLTAVGLGRRWDALALMIAFSAWTSGVFLFAAVRLRLEGGLPQPRLKDAASGPLFFAFLVGALATGLMMWGAGNTYVANYQRSTQVLTVENASPYGVDVLYRVGAAALAAFSILVAFAVAKPGVGARRSWIVPNVSAFVGLVLVAVIVFSVNVWSQGNRCLDQVCIEDAYAGFGFHQYGTEETVLAGMFLAAVFVVLAIAFRRLVSDVAGPRRAQVVAAIEIR